MSTSRHMRIMAGLLVLVALGACGKDDDAPATPAADGTSTPASPGGIEEQWEFYPARIDDQEASVLVDLGYRPVAPLAACPELLWVNITMPDPGKAGLGSPATAERFRSVEDGITKRLEARLSARLVARIRGKGKWQLRYYAPDADDLESLVDAALKGEDVLAFTVGNDADPEWRYYLDFLCPNEERSQWIKDRRLVEHLKKNGDTLTTPRPVDHWLYFKDPAGRKAFVASIEELGFRMRTRDKVTEGNPARPYSVNIERTDRVDLESIHRVVVRLMEAARPKDGVYDGWGCAIIRGGEDR